MPLPDATLRVYRAAEKRVLGQDNADPDRPS